MPEIIEKPSNNINTGQITDLNLVIANMKMSGMTGREIAEEMQISEAAVSQHLKRFKKLVTLNGELNTDPINNSRVRLTQRLANTESVLNYTLRPKVYRKSATYLGIAKDVSLNILKGLGVLVDKSEQATNINIYAQQREDQNNRIQAAKQFGLDPGKEIKQAEISAPIDVKDVDSDAQPVVPDDSPINVPRETEEK